MNKTMLKTLLLNNPQIIIAIIESMGGHTISPKENRIHFGLPENSGGRSHCIFLDNNLLHVDYPNSRTECVLTMISRIKKIPMESLSGYISLFTNQNVNFCKVNYDYQTEDKPLETYDKSIVDTFPKRISELFLKDGIPPSVQMDFNIRFSEEHNRVLIPIYQKGELVGIFGRYNQKVPDNEYVAKYLPILPYQKGKVLFPYDMNSKYVKRKKFCYLVESEKTTMVMYKYGWRNVFALGGNCVKTHQIELLKELGVTKIILALDKGLDKGHIEFVGMRLKECGFDVYYVDVESMDYLPNTDCVFDLKSKKEIEDSIRKYTRRIS